MVRTARPVRRVKAPTETTARTRKAPAKTVASKPEPAPDKAPAKKTSAGDEEGYAGFRAGSGAEIAAIALVKGGKSRTDIMRDLRQKYPAASKNWSVTISTVATSMFEKGFTDEGFYRMVPPPGVNLPPSRKPFTRRTRPTRPTRPARKLVATGSGRTTVAKTIPQTAEAPVVRRPRARNTPKS